MLHIFGDIFLDILQEEFMRIMKTLPVSVSEEEINEVGTTNIGLECGPTNHSKMFSYADRDHDGVLSYDEFQVMVSPPDIPRLERPNIAQLVVFSPRN